MKNEYRKKAKRASDTILQLKIDKESIILGEILFLILDDIIFIYMRRDSQLIFISVTFGSILHFRKKIRA
jgi:hypothetical protein